MGIQIQGMQVLEQAEEALRSLIHKGLEQQRYGEVATLARLAEGVASLRGTPAATEQQAIDRECEAPIEARVRSAAAPRRPPKLQPKSGSSAVGRYPRFERDAEVLIKVGWSKKHRAEYEHKAARENVEAFCRRLAEIAGGGSVFTMDEILPIKIRDDGDMPDYQTYLSLAWLRERGIVRKQGRDGYAVIASERLDSGFEQEWQALPVRHGDESHE